MKKYTLYIYMVCAIALSLTGCADDLRPRPYGWLNLSRPVQDTITDTRTAGETDTYLVSICKGEHTILKATPFSEITRPIALLAGNDYRLTAESCTESQAEHEPTPYGQPRYARTVPFGIQPNEQTKVNVTCTMDNAAFRLCKHSSFYYTSYILKAMVGTRELTFTDEQQMGYFNVEADGTAQLSYTIEATDAWGHKGRGSGTVTLKRKTLSILNLKAGDTGSIDLSVTYDDTFTPIITDIVLTP